MVSRLEQIPLQRGGAQQQYPNFKNESAEASFAYCKLSHCKRDFMKARTALSVVLKTFNRQMFQDMCPSSAYNGDLHCKRSQSCSMLCDILLIIISINFIKKCIIGVLLSATFEI